MASAKPPGKKDRRWKRRKSSPQRAPKDFLMPNCYHTAGTGPSDKDSAQRTLSPHSRSCLKSPFFCQDKKRNWQKSRGTVRRKFKGQILMPNIGYGSNGKTKLLLPSGFRKFLVHNFKELEGLLMKELKYQEAAEKSTASLTPLLKQGPSQLKPGGPLKGPATDLAKYKWDPRGWQAGSGGGPRAPPGPCSGMWSRRGHAGRGRAARTRGGAGPRRGQEVGAPGFRGSGSPPGSQPPAERPLQRGPRQYSGAVPLPSPGSAALPAPKTPSF
ncbi:hypothetical protein DBR06_SOUSAS3910047 [Sousa chinensis]|nr:hypothetical protein DBR06_SOUSAS3910047 [Sousa chinensis]